MIESRLTSVVLLDGSQFDCLITPEFLTSDLMDMVASHLNLVDKDYFGLSFIDSTGHRNWLPGDKKILDQELSKKNGVLVLFFSVKFYIENIAYTKDRVAVELFFLQTRLSIYQGDLEIHNDVIFELGALVLQALSGDYKSDKETIQLVKTQNILPKHFLANYNKMSSYYDQKIIGYYKKCSSLNRGQCIVNYLSIVEKLCNYGVHYYEVKDKTSTKWHLGISYRGIGLYESTNKIVPKKIFSWAKLENLYYRDKKFSIEVHEPQQQPASPNNMSPSSNKSVNSSQQQQQSNDSSSFGTFNPVKVYAWFASLPSLCKSIWLMAVAQHQFYLDKKQNRHNVLQFKSLNELANELNNKHLESLNNKLDESTISLGKMGRQISTRNLFGNHKNTDAEMNTIKSEMSSLFHRQKELLSKNLDLKRKQYQEIIDKHKEIDELSKLLVTDRTQIDKILKVLREFKQSNSINNQQNKNAFLDNLCIETDTQKKIMVLSLRLASDPRAPQLIQKQRREFYEKTKRRLAKLEKKTSKELTEAREAALAAAAASNQILATATSAESITNTLSHRMPPPLPQFNGEYTASNLDMRQGGGGEMTLETSPASIHRKDSYRRAQEQKLFLDSSTHNKRNLVNSSTTRSKVKPITTSLLLSNDMLNHTSSQKAASSQGDSVSLNSCTTTSNSNEKPVFSLTSDTMQESTKRVSPISGLIENAIMSTNNKFMGMNLNSNQIDMSSNNSSSLFENSTSNECDMSQTSGTNGNNYYVNTNSTFLDLETINEDLNGVSNGVGRGMIASATPILIGNSAINKKLIGYNVELTGPRTAATATRVNGQRKNTSDSNMKMLADHNFYHVTQRRGAQRALQSRLAGFEENSLDERVSQSLVNTHGNMISNGLGANSSSTSSSTSTINQNGKNITSILQNKPYELSDYFKYSAKYKKAGGLNSSSNSLVSLNSSSAGTNEDSNNGHIMPNGSNNYQNGLTSSRADIIRSNPDLKSMLALQQHSQQSLVSPIYHPSAYQQSVLVKSAVNKPTKLCHQSESVSVTNPLHSSSSSSLSNLASISKQFITSEQQHQILNNSTRTNGDLSNNNMSLNLSIHTAEEFGMEMLEWLNNEAGGNGNGGGIQYRHTSTTVATESKLAPNATLV